MKHGRRHKTLKEQAYMARKDAEGYGRPYRPIDVAEPVAPAPPPPPPEEPFAARLSTKDRKRLRHLGVDPDAEE